MSKPANPIVASGPIFVDWSDMTPEQRDQVAQYLVCKSLPLGECHRFAFRVNPDGSVRRQRGRHRFSRERQALYDQELRERLAAHREVPGDPAKGSIRHWLSGARYNFSNK